VDTRTWLAGVQFFALGAERIVDKCDFKINVLKLTVFRRPLKSSSDRQDCAVIFMQQSS
jgi:hypothetical protein